MSISVSMHGPKFRIYDLYPENPGSCINICIDDGKGNEVTVFCDDKSIRLLALEMQKYAAQRGSIPSPKSYAEALFEPAVPVADDDVMF